MELIRRGGRAVHERKASPSKWTRQSDRAICAARPRECALLLAVLRAIGCYLRKTARDSTWPKFLVNLDATSSKRRTSRRCLFTARCVMSAQFLVFFLGPVPSRRV